MKDKLMLLAAVLIIIIFVAFVLTVLIGTAAWWLYALIYALLFYIWYKPVLVFYHSWRSGHMLKRRDFSGVSQAYFQIARLKKNEGYGDYAEGLAYYYERNWAKARESLEEALNRGIRTQKKIIEPLTKMILIATLIELKQWSKAKTIIDSLDDKLKERSSLPPKLQVIYFPLKGEWLFHQEHYAEALEIFEKSYVRYPDLMGEEAYYYAVLLQQNHRTEEAITVLQTLLQQNNRWKFFRINAKKAEKLLEELRHS